MQILKLLIFTALYNDNPGFLLIHHVFIILISGEQCDKGLISICKTHFNFGLQWAQFSFFEYACAHIKCLYLHIPLC